MKKLCSRFALAAISTLLLAACDGTSPARQDLSLGASDFAGPALDMAPSGSDLATCGVCDCGTQIYRVVNASYPAVVASGVIVADTCLTGVTGPDLETSRIVKNDAMGNISIFSADGATLVGTGPVRCNKGILTSSPTVFTDGACRFTAKNTVSFTVTADSTFDVTVTQARSNTMSEAGMNCMQPATCTITYKVSHKL